MKISLHKIPFMYDKSGRTVDVTNVHIFLYTFFLLKYFCLTHRYREQTIVARGLGGGRLGKKVKGIKRYRLRVITYISPRDVMYSAEHRINNNCVVIGGY